MRACTVQNRNELNKYLIEKIGKKVQYTIINVYLF